MLSVGQCLLSDGNVILQLAPERSSLHCVILQERKYPPSRSCNRPRHLNLWARVAPWKLFRKKI
jgi:hypothetical protein